MSTKYAEDLTMNREEILTTETLETECTTEIELQTPEDKTPVTTTVTTYEERETDNEVLRSEHIATKGTNEPSNPSRGHEHTVIVTEQEVKMTTELHETECTTEINLSTTEDKTSVERTDTRHEERQPEYDGLSSENLVTEDTN